MRDLLFLLQAGFADPGLGPDSYYCTECAALEGLLACYPSLGGQLEVRRIGLDRSRALIPIGEYLAGKYGVPRPHP